VEASEKAVDWDLPDLTRMMLATGCRIGECLAIGRPEVDLDTATVDVRWRLVRRTGVGLLRLPSTKTGRRGERLIPLPSWAMTMLKRRRLAIGPTWVPQLHRAESARIRVLSWGNGCWPGDASCH
jgi:integrase